MKNKFTHIARMAALPLLLAACQNDGLPLPEPTPSAGLSTIAFQIKAEGAATRSYPENPQTEQGEGAVQHVSGARLYLFRHGSDGTTYFAGYEEVPDWNSLPITDGGQTVGNYGGTTTVTRSYTLKTRLQPFTEYTVLGIGYEKDADQSGTTHVAATTGGNNHLYGDYAEYAGDELLANLKADVLPEDGSVGNPASGPSNGSVVALKALVSSLATPRGKADIQRSEYFTGTVTAITESNGCLPDKTLVPMERRVAGLSAKFRLKDFSQQPGGVAVMLYADQNKAVPTLQQEQQEPFFNDYTKDPLTSSTASDWRDNLKANPQCIVFLDIIDDNAAEGGTQTNQTNANGEWVTEEKSVYLLPIPAPDYEDEKNYTLAAVVYNKDGKVICTKRAALNVGTGPTAQLIFATNLGTGIVDDESYYRYPIIANRFYRFDGLALQFDPSNPFEVIVENGWEGEPEMDFE